MPPEPTTALPSGRPTRPAAANLRRPLAEAGERLAASLLEQTGLTVVDRNWRCALGEIDLVARAPGLLVVCEVKTRRSNAFGHPAAAVTWAKQERLRRLALAYLASHPGAPRRVRFDVVAVHWPRHGRPSAEHLPGAFP